MKDLVDSINRSLETKNYFSAIFVALSIPDICGKLENPDLGNGARARKWFDEYLAYMYSPNTLLDAIRAVTPYIDINKMPEHVKRDYASKPAPYRFDSKDFWGLRNAILHEVSDEVKTKKYILTPSEAHLCTVNGMLQISVIKFSNDIVAALNKWMEKVSTDEVIAKRIDKLAKIQNSALDGAIYFG